MHYVALITGENFKQISPNFKELRPKHRPEAV